MKVIHCVGWYFPSSVGGSEIYVQRLARELQARGVEVAIVAPYDAVPGRGEIERYEHEGTRVLLYPVPPPTTAEQVYGDASHAAFNVFERLLLEERADVFHLHSLTYGANGHHVRAARRLGMRTFATVHTPSLMCMRATMRRMGHEVCDGRVDPVQCVPCYLEHRGVPERAAVLLGAGLRRLPRGLPRVPGRVGTLLATADLVRGRAAQIAQLFGDVERVIAVCEWLRVALIANGAAPNHVVLHRQGVDPPPVAARTARVASATNAPLSIGYFGRAQAVKGIEVLISAVRALPASLGVTLDLYVIASLSSDQRELKRVAELVAGDTRIALHPPVPPNEVTGVMLRHDVIAVPSLWLETGPLVAMEALVLGIPVLGSRLGGIAELVEDGVSGWLEPPGDVARWSARIAELAQQPELVARAGVRARQVPVRRSADVAEAMLALYR